MEKRRLAIHKGRCQRPGPILSMICLSTVLCVAEWFWPFSPTFSEKHPTISPGVQLTGCDPLPHPPQPSPPPPNVYMGSRRSRPTWVQVREIVFPHLRFLPMNEALSGKEWDPYLPFGFAHVVTNQKQMRGQVALCFDSVFLGLVVCTHIHTLKNVYVSVCVCACASFSKLNSIKILANS